MNIILLEPENPSNAGTIARTCVLSNSTLHLIEPLGFRLTDKYLKRAGMDYLKHIDIKRWMNLDDFYENNPSALTNTYFATTKANHTYTEVSYKIDDYIMFGRESAGIPNEILNKNKDRLIRIPMYENKVSLRSLNLSNSVSIVLFEALRQLEFPDMKL